MERNPGVARVKPADLAVLFLLFLSILFCQFTTPSVFVVSKEDPRFLYNHSPRTIQIVLFVVFTCVIFPVLVIVVHRLVGMTFLTLSKSVVAYWMSVLTALLFVSLLQIYVGMPRPDTVSVCGDVTLASCQAVLSRWQAMRQFKSFPDDFAAVISCACVFVSKFAHALWVNDSTWAVMVKLIPLALLSWCMAASIAANASSPSDIAMGTMIGVVIGLVFAEMTLRSR